LLLLDCVTHLLVHCVLNGPALLFLHSVANLLVDSVALLLLDGVANILVDSVALLFIDGVVFSLALLLVYCVALLL